MTLISPSFISPATSKFFSYLPFTNHNKTHAEQQQQKKQKQSQQIIKSPDLPTYITIIMKKDGTPTTKCLNPPLPITVTSTSNRPTISNRRRRSSLSSSSSSQNLASPQKQRRLMISSFIPRFNSYSRRNNNSGSSNKDNNSAIATNDLMTVMMTDQKAASTIQQSSSAAAVTGEYNLCMKDKRHLSHLPSELTIKILLSLDCKSILNLSSTCKQFYRMCHKQHDYLWQTLFKSDYLVVYKNQKQQPILAYELYKNHFELAKRWKYGQVNTKYLTGHQDSVYCLVWVGNHRIVSGSRDRSIKLWDLEQQEQESCLLTKVAHEGSVLCLRVSADNSFLVSGSSDTTCLIWSLSDLQPTKRLVGHSGGVLDVCIMGDSIVSSSRDATIRVWDRLTGQEKRRLVGHAGPVNALGGSSQQDGRVVSASGDTTLKLWDIETGDCLRTFMGHTRGLACVRFDGKLIYSGGQDNKLKVWDVDTGQCVSTLAGHSDLIRTIDSFEDKAVSGSYDRTLRVWDAKENKCLLSFQSGHSSWIFNCLLSRTKIISAGQDKKIMVLDFGYDLTTLE